MGLFANDDIRYIHPKSENHESESRLPGLLLFGCMEIPFLRVLLQKREKAGSGGVGRRKWSVLGATQMSTVNTATRFYSPLGGKTANTFIWFRKKGKFRVIWDNIFSFLSLQHFSKFCVFCESPMLRYTPIANWKVSFSHRAKLIFSISLKFATKSLKWNILQISHLFMSFITFRNSAH